MGKIEEGLKEVINMDEKLKSPFEITNEYLSWAWKQGRGFDPNNHDPSYEIDQVTGMTNILLKKLEEAGYLPIEPVNLEGLGEWIDIPTKRGEYWLSPFCEGRYISPRIMSVIDYERPDRGLEVQYDFPHDTIPIKIFVKEYYPKAKWMLIKEPELPKK